jgi:Putative esterase
MKMLLRFALTVTISLAPLVAAPTFSVSFPREQSVSALDGRLLLMLSTDPSAEPRMQINVSPNTQLIFGMDVDGMQPGQEAIVDDHAFGYPVRSLAELKPGHYYVQALLHRYETFHLAAGHTVKLPMDRGEGQHWNLAPGNLYSKPREITLDASSSALVKILMDQQIPPIPEPKDTKYVRHIRIKSELLSRFWGRPMYLGAHVLVPEGFEEHTEAHYPLAVFHGHFPSDLSGFRTDPPDPNLKPDYSDRFHLGGYNRIQEEEAYAFYQQWISPKFPRFLVIEIQHPTPYYDDSYAVNSANIGPYGDAIETELIPYIEKRFRGLGQGWARFLYGGSTGGWEALAVQMFYPDHYNGTFAACPDPVDFRAYTVVDIYKDKNAYFLEGPHKRVARPGMRDYLGHISVTLQDLNNYELALGSKGRSGEQWDIWQAVFSPMGKDGYPSEIWDKLTGEIHPDIAGYWREHYDLSYIVKRDWSTLGPKLKGKIHIYVGSADNYFLNDAVYSIEDFLKGTVDPPYEGEVKYGDRAEHCWNGDPALSNALSRLHYNTQYLPKILERMQKTAPPGADLTSWRY